MRSAPPVSFPVGRSFAFGMVWLALGAVSLLVLFSAWRASGPSSTLTWPDLATDTLPAARASAWLAGAALWVTWAWLSFRSWHRWPEGLLNWDPRESQAQDKRRGMAQDGVQDEARRRALSGAWSWRSAGYLDGVKLLQVEVALDVQSRVLLRLHFPDAACSWVWAERGSDPARWGDFRRALVHSRR